VQIPSTILKANSDTTVKIIIPTGLPNNAGEKIGNVHGELQRLADTLDGKISDLLDAHEKDFFLAYKTHM
jgi:hypothetical protein